MSSYVDMSLEEIIKTRKKAVKRKDKPSNLKPGNGINTKKLTRTQPQKLVPIGDARNKIISKKRTQIVDARDKLAELAKKKDARIRLEQLKQMRAKHTQQIPRSKTQQNHGKFKRPAQIIERGFVDRSRQVVSQPLTSGRINRSTNRPVNVKKFLESRSIGTRHRDPMPPCPVRPIMRTVENDIELIDDPMSEDDYINPSMSLLNRKANLQLKITAHNSSDLRSSRNSNIQRTIGERERSPPKPPSILKKRPMAALRTDTKPERIEKPLEYRIIVSNLRSTVTAADIEELFGDIGGMLESRLVRAGTAEVIYKTLEYAQKAVELYHNRQLDGQPMNCLLVTPRQNLPPPVRSSTKAPLYSSNSNVEPDISTFHKVLFSHYTK